MAEAASHGPGSKTPNHQVNPSPDQNLVTSPDNVLQQMMTNPDYVRMRNGAIAAADREHSMSLREAIKLYPKGILFSVIMSLGIVMDGYDTALIGAFFAQPAFQKRFGAPHGSGYQLSSNWQSGLLNAVTIGQIIGAALAGTLAERFGYKKTMLGSLLVVIGGISILFFATSIEMLLVGDVICGLPWGAFQLLGNSYAADVTPIQLRPILTTYVNLCWLMGQLIANGVLRGLSARVDQWGWRIPFAIQWIWPIPIAIGILFAPESPVWLVRKGRLVEAKQALLALTSSQSGFDADNACALIMHTNEHEKFVSAGTSYWDCFRGFDRRRTEIACMAWSAQCLCGLWFGGNIVYFLEQANFPASEAFNFGVGMSGLGFLATISAWFVIPRVGRRTMSLFGLSLLATILLIVGFLGIPPPTNTALGWASGGLLMLFIFTFDISVGPLAYSFVAEIPSSRLRIKTIVVARSFSNAIGIGANFLNPAILNPTAWNLRGKGGFVWAGTCLFTLVWAYFRLPEPKGLTSAEMDVLFENGVSARKFHSTKADPYRTGS